MFTIIYCKNISWFTKIFCQIKQNYTKNEHFIQQWSIFGLFARNFDFEFHIYYKSIAQSSFLTHLVPITVPSMLKAALKNFQWVSSLFTLSVFTTILFFMQCQFSFFRKFFRFQTFLSIVLTIDFCYSHLVFLLSSRGVPGPGVLLLLLHHALMSLLRKLENLFPFQLYSFLQYGLVVQFFNCF